MLHFIHHKHFGVLTSKHIFLKHYKNILPARLCNVFWENQLASKIILLMLSLTVNSFRTEAQKLDQLDEMNTSFLFSLNLNLENRLSDNSLFTDYNKQFSSSYHVIYDSYSPPGSMIYSRNYFELDKGQLAVTAMFGFKVVYNQYICLSVESINRKQLWYNQEKTTGSIGFGAEWNDPLFLIHYLYKFPFSKHLSLGLSGGIGLAIDTKSDLSIIFAKTTSNYQLYKDNPAYIYQNEQFVITTRENYRNTIYPLASPKIQFNYRKGKHFQLQVYYGAYLSLIHHDGIHVELIDLKTGKSEQSANYNFSSYNTFFGFGFTYYWGK